MNLCCDFWSGCQLFNGPDNLCLANMFVILEFFLKVTICLSPANLSGKMAAEEGDEGRMELRSCRNEFTRKENMFLFEIMERLTQIIWLNTFCLV